MRVLQLLAAGGVGLALLLMVRRIARWSPLAGGLVAIGLLLRAALGLGLFWVSFLQLPMMRDVQLGDGFWAWALDASNYYVRAVGSMNSGWVVGLAGDRGPSPLFVRTLGAWLMVVGVSPASAILLNIACYVLLCAAIVWLFREGHLREGGSLDPPRRDRTAPSGQMWGPPLGGRQMWGPPLGGPRDPAAAILPVAALTFSPALLLFSTQPLKDVFFVALVGMLCVAASQSTVDSRQSPVGRRLLWFALFMLAAYAIADVRWYYALLVFGSACLAALIMVVLPTGHHRVFQQPAKLAVRLLVGVITLRLLWIAVMLGNGYYYPSLAAAALGHPMQGTSPVSNVGTVVDAVSRIPSDREISLTLKWRGSTNIAIPSDQHDANVAPIMHPVKAEMLGLAALFVPMFALRALWILDVNVGGVVGLLMELDTLFLDATLVAVAVLLVRGRSQLRARLPFVVFVATLALSTTVLMAYVVTNYGAMFRLRSILAVPFWMLPLALAHGAPKPGPAATL